MSDEPKPNQTPETSSAPASAPEPALPAPVVPPPAAAAPAVPVPPATPATPSRPPVAPYSPPPQGYYGPPPGTPPYYQAPPQPAQPPVAPAGYRPPGFAPQPPRKRSSAGLIIGVIMLVIFLCGGAFLFVTALMSASQGGGTMTTASAGFPFGQKIAILEVNGVLGEGPGFQADTDALIRQVREWQDNSSIKGMVVRVNSPGGAVSATQELVQAIEKYREATGNPVVTSMGDIAASGGYYTAMATDHVFANEGTLTGSIGVIMSFYDLQGIQSKIGIASRSIKSGEFKDIGSGSRAMTTEEKALLQDMIMDTYGQFLGKVVSSRGTAVRENISQRNGGRQVSAEEIEKHIREFADGRIFSGTQAISGGMIDEIGTLQDAIDHVARRAGITGKAKTIKGPIRRPTLFGAITQKVEAISHEMPGTVRFEYRFAM